MKVNMMSAAALLGSVLGTGGAFAQAPDYMREDCTNATQSFFQAFDARTDTTYEGQRTDGTHAVNGTIYLENRSETFQCSYASDGETMVDFVAEGKSWPDFAMKETPAHISRRRPKPPSRCRKRHQPPTRPKS